MIKINFIKTAFFIGFITTLSLFLTGCGSKDVSVSVNAANANNAQPQIVDVSTATAVVHQIPTYFEVTGTLACDAQTDVAPTVGGKIVQVNFDIGSYVAKGSVLVRLDDRDARIRLDQANAQVAQAESNVRQAQASVEQARSNVRQVQAQLGLRGDQGFDVYQVAEVKTAKAALDLAEKELKRNERLLESGDISRSIYDQRRSQFDQAQAQYQAALNGGNQRFAAIQTAQAQVDTALAAVRSSQSAADASRTQVETAQKAIADTLIYSPISGYVSERVADVGEFAATTSKIATILRTSVLRLRIDVPEQNIGQVKTGQGISLQTSAYPDRNFAGTVARISPSLNVTSRVLVVEAEVDNSEGLLKPGQFATVRISQSTPNPAVMVPTSAVKTEGETNKIYVIKEGRAEEHLVQLGLLENNLIEVKQGVGENDLVATSNLNLLYDGVAVRR